MPSQRLPAKYLLMQTQDLDAARSVIERLYAPFSWKLSSSHKNTCGTVSVHTAKWGPLALSMLGYGHDIEVCPEGLGGSLLVTTVLAGRMLQRNSTGESGGGPGSSVLAVEGDSPVFRYSRQAEVLKLNFSQYRIDALCWELLGHQGTKPVRFCANALEGAASQRWMDLLTYLIASLSDSESCLPDRLAGGLEDVLVLHLLNSARHNYSEELHRSPAPLVPREYRRACAYMEAHWRESIALLDVARAVGCSVRSLSRAFHCAGQTTPMRYLMELRLQRVHELLRNGTMSDTTIVQAALECGFNHLGEFHLRYRRRFGESPSQTRARSIL